MDSTFDRPAFYGPTFPSYPPPPQLVRVVSGPDGNGVYRVKTQQANMPAATFRDREDGYLVEPNGIALPAGSFLRARLAASYPPGGGGSSSPSAAPLYVASLLCCKPKPFPPSPSLSGVSSPPSAVSSPPSVASSPGVSSPGPSSPGVSSPGPSSPGVSSPGPSASASSAPMVNTDCCGLIPQTLHATISGSGCCDGTYVMQWGGGQNWNSGGQAVGTCTAVPGPCLNLTCAPPPSGARGWSWQNPNVSPIYDDAGSTCSPVHFVFSGIDFTSYGGNAGATIVVTL